MGILDDLRHKAEELGDKAKDGLDAARDKAAELVDDVKDRLDHDETPPLTESSDIGPDSSSTDAVQPGYVTAEDDVTEETDEDSLGAEAELDAETTPTRSGWPPSRSPVVESGVVRRARVGRRVRCRPLRRAPHRDRSATTLGDPGAVARRRRPRERRTALTASTPVDAPADGGRELDRPLPDVAALEAEAEQVLPAHVLGYYRGPTGAYGIPTEAERWSQVRFRPHVLRDTSRLSLATTVLGTPVASPVLVAPMAQQRAAHPDGEVATARAVRRRGVLLGVSTNTGVPFADVAAVGAPWWFQVYVMDDRAMTADLVQRAAADGRDGAGADGGHPGGRPEPARSSSRGPGRSATACR